MRKFPTRTVFAAQSTFDAIRLGAAHNPDAPAIQYLPNANGTDKPIVISHPEFVAGVTQAANMFHALGVNGGDVVSFLLPLLPEAFTALFGAEAAGIANPVNPLLEPYQITEILEAAHTKVLVTLGPVPGTDIWQKVEQVRGSLKHLKAIVQVHGPGDQANGIYSFSDLIKTQPSDRLVGGRQISGDQICGLLPHRRHHRHTEACPAYPRQPSLSGLGHEFAVQIETQARISCSACRCSTSAAR